MNINQQTAANQSQQDKNNASGGELTQKQVAKQSKAKAARASLKKISQEAKAVRLGMVQEAKTLDEKMAADALGVNEVIVMMYQKSTGFNDFKTFADWKKAGYSVNKGETGFPVWGKPRKVKQSMTDEEDRELVADEWEFYPVCYLFNESQVSKKGGNDDDKTPSKKADENNADTGEKEDKPTGELLAVAEPSPFVTSDYAERQDARRERLQERAERKRQESDASYQRSRELVEHIPMGQPILVGHHSERAHRNALDKSWQALGKSVALSGYADSLEGRAARVGKAGISSTDPDAIQKLKSKLSGLEKAQEKMKAVNKIVKSKKLNDAEKVEKIVSDGLLERQQAGGMLKPDFAGRVGFADYALQNNNAEIRRTRKRIEELEQLHNSDPLEFENEDFSIFVDNGQIVIDFPGGKPNEEVRTMMKRSYSFKFSRHRSAWVRKVTANALTSARHLLDYLKAVEEIY